jgi:hypothetical protein
MGNYTPGLSKPSLTLLLLVTFLITVMVLSIFSSPDLSLPIVSAQSHLPASEQPKVSIVEKPHQSSTSEANNTFAGNLNQSSSTSISLSNTLISSMQTPGREAFNLTSQPSNSQAISALQHQQQQLQQYQSNFPPDQQQQYYQYPTQQLQQNQQYSYPSNNLTNIPYETGLQPPPSSLPEGALALQQPTQQQQLPSNLATGIQPPMGAGAPETFIISAIDNNGQNILSGSTVSSQFISLTFVGTDDVGHIVDFQCSYDGQLPYSCASPFTIDNSLVVIPTNIPIAPGNNNTHTLLISAVDSSRNVDQTPASFVWNIVGVQGSTETIPGQEPLTSTLSSTVPQTEPTASTSELSQQQMSQQQLAGDIAQESLYNNIPSGEP